MSPSYTNFWNMLWVIYLNKSLMFKTLGDWSVNITQGVSLHSLLLWKYFFPLLKKQISYFFPLPLIRFLKTCFLIYCFYVFFNSDLRPSIL